MDLVRWFGPKKIWEPIERPAIAPVGEGLRPFWSIMLPTYQRTTYLAEALRSVLEQDQGPERMQIEVVDNASTSDEVEALVRSVGGGRVAFFRQPAHVGMAENWNTCAARARGRWVHILHDDDAVLPGFYRAYEEIFAAHPEVGLVFSRAIAIDETGDWNEILPVVDGFQNTPVVGGLSELLAVANFLYAPAVAVARDVYTRVGGFSPSLGYCPDWEMWARIAAALPVGYSRKPLALYRRHSSALTSEFLESGGLLVDSLKAEAACADLVGAEKRADVGRRARRWLAGDAIRLCRELLVRRRRASAARYAMWALLLEPGPTTLLRIIGSYARARIRVRQGATS
jgi:glycosyltransferase involved in cell wall biosynthesis